MLRFLLTVCALFAVVTASTNPMHRSLPMLDGRIVGGEPTEINKYPHQISMRYNGRHRCGGSVYSQNVIVSAAHCVSGLSGPDNLSIVAGSSILSEGGVELPVLKFIIHEQYRTVNNDYDVALLVLQGLFTFSEVIQPIPLAKERPVSGTPVTVTGWGTLVEGGDIPDQLQTVNVDIVDNSKCKSAYSYFLTSRMLCAGVEAGGKDACQGDSGGPLISDGLLLGIVSWGTGCAREKYPGVYASVPELGEWIAETAAKNEISYSFY